MKPQYQFGAVAHGALELYLPQIRKCHFWSDLCLFVCIFEEKVPIETFHISS